MKILSADGEETFAYNNLGSPTTYRNKQLQWQYGKLLTKYGDTTFEYDGLGRRIKKGDIKYVYDSAGKLVSSSDETTYTYDDKGPTGFITPENGLRFYRKDVQGNIIAILDNDGEVVVRYEYDAWGNHKVLDGNGNEITDPEHIGHLNPIRYRGYFYDEETGLYYLQTRYYDPTIGRFISQDGIEYADPQTPNGINLYAYCANNPVMAVDPTGHKWWHWLIGAIVVVALVVATIVTAGGAAAGALALGAAAMGTTAIGASALTTTLAFAAVGAGTMFTAFGVVAGLSSIETWATGGTFVDGLKSFSDYGETAMLATVTSGIAGAAIGYTSYVDYGTKTPGKLRPFGTYYNIKDESITHYGINGKMWWSEHYSDHGNPSLHPFVPHWHAEMPHYPGSGFGTFGELVKELIIRLFGGGHK